MGWAQVAKGLEAVPRSLALVLKAAGSHGGLGVSNSQAAGLGDTGTNRFR